MQRREFLISSLMATIFSYEADASKSIGKTSWRSFQARVNQLSKQIHDNEIDQQLLIKSSLKYLSQLDIDSKGFTHAIGNAYETGNQFWLWQRLMKTPYINGGILTIDQKNTVQAHDHPEATGMMRIISGEVEVWTFDEARPAPLRSNSEWQDVELITRSHRILHKGDVAILQPDEGNIHALKSISKECRMLDIFIPPYRRNIRSWYKPVDTNWETQKTAFYKKLSQQNFNNA